MRLTGLLRTTDLVVFISIVILSSANGTLEAGQSTTVTVEIGCGANGLSAGGSSDTATFTSSAKGDGNIRSVSLAVNPLDPATLTGLTISNDPGVLCDQSSSDFTAVANWDNGTTSVVPATWSVFPTTYASIDAVTGVLTTYDTHEVSVTVEASYTFNGVTTTAIRTVGITDCHVDGPMWSCAVVGHPGKTTPVDLGGAYPILVLILILGLLKVRGSRGKKIRRK